MTEHANIAKALAAAQAEMGKALKQSNNPHFRSKYADLGSVMDACLPALNAHGIAVIQPFMAGEFGNLVKTTFLHESGETLETSIPLILGKNDMQGLGSAITYARRYGLMSLAGIAPEDDDGNAAATAAPKANPTRDALKDAWKDAVEDGLPANATPRQKAEAYAKAICGGFTGKGEKALENEWDRRKQYIAAFEKNHPDLHEKVVDAFETAMQSLEETKGAA